MESGNYPPEPPEGRPPRRRPPEGSPPRLEPPQEPPPQEPPPPQQQPPPQQPPPPQQQPPPPQQPRTPLPEEPPTDDWPTGDYPTSDYPDIDPEERERRRIPRERRPPVRRGRRHRDLPARVRRRQAIAAIVLVVGAGIVAYFALAGAPSIGGGGGGGGGGSGSPESKVPVENLVGQTVIGNMAPKGPSKQLLKRVRAGQLGGVIVGANSEPELRRFVTRLTKANDAGDNNPPLLIMIDQEGGPVKRVPGPPDLSPTQLGKTGDAVAARAQGQQTGAFLAKAGVNVDLAPVADVIHPKTPKTLSTRMFSSDPTTVGQLSSGFASGLQEGGVAATVKHFPGIGLANQNTDFGRADVTADTAAVQADEKPFADAIKAGVKMVMLSTAIYQTFGSDVPAAWTDKIVQDELRGKLGFNGVAMTDDLEAASVAPLTPAGAAEKALMAGCDLVLFARTEPASVKGYKFLLKAVKKGRLPRTTIEEAYRRIQTLKNQLASGLKPQ